MKISFFPLNPFERCFREYCNIFVVALTIINISEFDFNQLFFSNFHMNLVPALLDFTHCVDFCLTIIRYSCLLFQLFGNIILNLIKPNLNLIFRKALRPVIFLTYISGIRRTIITVNNWFSKYLNAIFERYPGRLSNQDNSCDFEQLDLKKKLNSNFNKKSLKIPKG